MPTMAGLVKIAFIPLNEKYENTSHKVRVLVNKKTYSFPFLPYALEYVSDASIPRLANNKMALKAAIM